MENDYSPKNYGSDASANKILIKPLIASDRTEHFPFEQLMRVKFQILTLALSAKTKKGTYLGDTQFFDLFVNEEPSWGRWGIGPMAIIPTTSTLDAGQGKWQVGPALGVSILKFTGWQIGFLAQNPISVAENSHKPKQNYLLFQPFVIYLFLKDTYVISNSEWTIDWITRTQQIPVNIGIDHTASLVGNLKVDSLLQFQYMAHQNAVKSVGYVNQCTIQLSLNILLGD
ncbi:MAG: hypothetical protein Q8K75_02035 [Chlamydiales bacterium]|nr:hypothetical protein [Chlamydiales bacterium]